MDEKNKQTYQQSLRIDTAQDWISSDAGDPNLGGRLVNTSQNLSGPFTQNARVHESRSTVQPEAHSLAASTQHGFADPTLGSVMPQRPRHPFRLGESRFPLLQATVDELAEEEAYEDLSASVASIASNLSTSPPSVTQLELSRGQDCQGINPTRARASSSISPTAKSILSSRPIDSPLQKAVRRSRRSSARSNSLNSPASAFLSQFSREAEPPPVQPDDEGQIIGEHGEYVIGDRIGYGGFGVVKEVVTIEDDRKVRRAAKIVRKRVKDRSTHENDMLQLEFEHEVTIWRYLKHRFILPLISVYENAFATYCITRLNTGGTLFDLIRSLRRPTSSSASISSVTTSSFESKPARRSNAMLAAHLVKRYSRQLASALRYMHNDMHIVHRDVKLENVLLDTSSTPGGNILLCDFGMAEFIRRSDRDPATSQNQHNLGPSVTSTSVNGSLQYASPELIEAREPLFSPAVDIWAFGVVVYALLTGELPFSHPLLPKLQNLILEGRWDEERLRRAVRERDDHVEMNDEDVEEEAENAIKLVKNCLAMDPRRRWSVRNILDCEFLAGYEDEGIFG